MISHKKIALIHIIKKELKLSDEEYRDILERAAGVRSSKDLTETSFRLLMRYFVRSGYYQKRRDGLTLKQKMYIKYLAHTLEWNDLHLANYLQKYFHKREIESLSKKEASGVITALTHILSRQK